MEFSRRPDELEEQYIYRICSNKDKIGNWYDVAEIINANLGYEYTESKYRKQYHAYQRMFKNVERQDEVDEHQMQLDELYKAKVRLQDQRRVYNNILRSDARYEHLEEVIKNSVESLKDEVPLVFEKPIMEVRDKEAVLAISDIHYGMNYEGVWNKYNTEIAKERIQTLVLRTIEYIMEHCPKVLHIVLLGDSAHGAIHVNARIQSDEDVCDQIIHISEILAKAISTLASYVPQTIVYSTYGNHLRTIQNKNESVHSDNMEKIIPWYLKARLSDRDDIDVRDENKYEFIYLDVCGHGIVATHGDLDSFRRMGVNLSTMFHKAYGLDVEYTISGDKHHIEEYEQLGVESILVPSLCGTDSYANEKRLYSKPAQTLMFFTPRDGRQCTYNIAL